MTRFACAALLATVMIGSQAHAQTGFDGRALQACATIGDDAPRLSCYDGIVRTAKPGQGQAMTETPRPQPAVSNAK